MNDRSRKNGSAILIALFVMATLGAVTFGASRIYISEIKSTTNLSTTAAAYYAADGALEKGLLEYRKDPNKEFDFKNPPDDVTIQHQTIMKEANKFKTKYLSDKLSATKEVPQDESRQAIVTEGSSVFLNWTWKGINGDPPTSGGIVVTTVDNANNVLRVINVPQSQSSLRIQIMNKPTIIRFRPLGKGLASYSLTPTTGNQIDSGKATIDAVGTANSLVSRQLRAEIDRTTGKLFSVFDYTLFGKDSIQ